MLAHEVEHLRSGDTKAAGVIAYTGTMLMHLARQERLGSTRLIGLVRSHSAHFHMQATAEQRTRERSADVEAARFIGADRMGRALVRVSLAFREWTEREQDAVESIMYPPARVAEADRLGTGAASVAHEMRTKWLRLELSAVTAPDSTHPCLRDRLAALGVDPDAMEVPPVVPASCSAAAEWLGPLADRMESGGTPEPSRMIAGPSAQPPAVECDDEALRMAWNTDRNRRERTSVRTLRFD
ncbi:MAG: M48 family metalloprotease, partial [Planctomycetota bacterium]